MATSLFNLSTTKASTNPLSKISSLTLTPMQSKVPAQMSIGKPLPVANQSTNQSRLDQPTPPAHIITPNAEVNGANTDSRTNPRAQGVSSGTFSDILKNVQASGILQSQPSSPNLSQYDSIIAPALNALSSYQAQLQSTLPSTLSDLEAQKNVASQNLQNQQSDQLNNYNTQRTGAQQNTENAVAEQRRAFSELQRGLQAQYGGSTGTGAFATELAGRQTLTNIAQIRQGLDQTMSQIANAEDALKKDVSNKLFQLQTSLDQAKNDARNNLMEKIQQINMKKGELESNKASMKLDAMKEYRNLQAQIDAQNKQFIQGLYQGFQAEQYKIQAAKDQTNGLTQILSQVEKTPVQNAVAEPKPTAAPDGIRAVPTQDNQSQNDQTFDPILDNVFLGGSQIVN